MAKTVKVTLSKLTAALVKSGDTIQIDMEHAGRFFVKMSDAGEWRGRYELADIDGNKGFHSAIASIKESIQLAEDVELERMADNQGTCDAQDGKPNKAATYPQDFQQDAYNKAYAKEMRKQQRIARLQELGATYKSETLAKLSDSTLDKFIENRETKTVPRGTNDEEQGELGLEAAIREVLYRVEGYNKYHGTTIAAPKPAYVQTRFEMGMALRDIALAWINEYLNQEERDNLAHLPINYERDGFRPPANKTEQGIKHYRMTIYIGQAQSFGQWVPYHEGTFLQQCKSFGDNGFAFSVEFSNNPERN